MLNVFEDARKEKIKQEKNLTDVERKSSVKYMLAVVKPIDCCNGQILRYSIRSNTWELVRGVGRLVDSVLNCINNCLYLIQQEPCGKFEYKTITSIPLSTMQPKCMKSAIYNTCYFATVAVDHYLYIIGGCLEDCSDAISEVQRYDTKTNKWKKIGKLNHGRFNTAATVLAGKVYVVGGTNYSNIPFGSVERYDPDTNQWTEVAQLNVARAGHRCCSIKGQVFAVGGCNRVASYKRVDAHLASIEKYDEQINKWTIISPHLDIPRSNFGIGTLGDWIYIAGGSVGIRNYLDDLQRINVTDGRIEKLSLLSQKMSFVDSVMVR